MLLMARLKKQMLWDMRSGEEEGVVRSECKTDECREQDRQLDHLIPLATALQREGALTLQR